LISVKVTATTDPVKNVTLHYSADNGTTWTGNPMTYNASTSSYEASKTGQPPGTLVKYRIVAFDIAEKQAVTDNAGEYFVYGVIPEFSSAVILLWAMMLTLAGVVVGKRKRSTKQT